jgi:uncharacterized protein (TIGR04206 family)
MWVRSEYAGELAVVSAWLTALLPWSVTVIPEFANLVVIRFVFFRFQYLTAADLPEDVARPFLWTFQMPEFQRGTVFETASLVWLLGAVVVLAALALSVAYYLREERVESMAFDPVRTMGSLIALAAGLHTVSFALVWPHQHLTIPLGLVVMYVLAAILLRVERTGTPGEGSRGTS